MGLYETSKLRHINPLESTYNHIAAESGLLEIEQNLPEVSTFCFVFFIGLQESQSIILMHQVKAVGYIFQ